MNENRLTLYYDSKLQAVIPEVYSYILPYGADRQKVI